MRRLALAASVSALVAASCSGAAAQESGWTDAGTKRGVALAFRENPAYGAREVRATTELPFSAAQVADVACDFPSYPAFVPGILEATLLEGNSGSDYVVYIRYSPRFLVIAARDVILQVHREADPDGVFRCSWSGLQDRLPARSDAVRMPLNTGSWTLEPLGDSRARVVYQVAVKPGGRLPDWLVRWGTARALPEVMEVVQKRLAASP